MARQETLNLQQTGKPALDLRAIVYRSLQTSADELFSIELSDRHFSAMRNLTVEDIVAMRDWCNEALAGAETMQAAE